MKDFLQPYSISLDILEDENDENKIDIDLEDEHPLISDIQTKYVQLNERFISLKATADTLKNQIEEEKDLWKQELKETIEMEKQYKEQQQKHYEMIVPDESEIKRKFEIFRDFLFFSHATENIEQLTRKNNYQQWLTDVESECSLELDRIQKSLTALRPLKEMASNWKSGDFSCSIGADGDKEVEADEKRSDDGLCLIKESNNFSAESDNGMLKE